MSSNQARDIFEQTRGVGSRELREMLRRAAAGPGFQQRITQLPPIPGPSNQHNKFQYTKVQIKISQHAGCSKRVFVFWSWGLNVKYSFSREHLKAASCLVVRSDVLPGGYRRRLNAKSGSETSGNLDPNRLPRNTSSLHSKASDGPSRKLLSVYSSSSHKKLPWKPRSSASRSSCRQFAR